jgi:hypothetical protein
MQANIAQPLASFLSENQKFTDMLEKISLEQRYVSKEEFLNRYYSAQQATLALWDISVIELNNLINIRIKNFENNRLKILMWTSLAIIIALVIFMILVNSITIPLNLLQKAMLQIANGEHDIEVPGLNNRDEIGIMANTVEVFRKLQKLIITQTEELKIAKNKEEAANIAKSEFLANTTHELRTPMNAVLGMTELVLTTDLDPKQKKYAIAIQNSGNAMLDLIEEILDFTMFDNEEYILENYPIIIESLFAEIIETLEVKAATHNTKIEYYCEDDVPQCVLADLTSLRMIIVNLVDNALKFTKNGKVIIRILQLSQTDNKSLLRFEVEDTGIGIPKDMQKAIFGKFIQVDSSSTRKFGGIGLGLSICKTLVNKMGGKIGVISKVGKGSTFWVELELPIEHKNIEKPTIYKGSRQ